MLTSGFLPLSSSIFLATKRSAHDLTRSSKSATSSSSRCRRSARRGRRVCRRWSDSRRQTRWGTPFLPAFLSSSFLPWLLHFLLGCLFPCSSWMGFYLADRSRCPRERTLPPSRYQGETSSPPSPFCRRLLSVTPVPPFDRPMLLSLWLLLSGISSPRHRAAERQDPAVER